MLRVVRACVGSIVHTHPCMSLYTVTYERDATLRVVCACVAQPYMCAYTCPHIVAHECDITLRVVRVCVGTILRAHLCMCVSMQLHTSVTRHALHLPIYPPVQRHARVTQKIFQNL